MAKYKTEFELELLHSTKTKGTALIIGETTKGYHPYVKFDFVNAENQNNEYFSAYIKDKDLERFAVNILRSLNSKHLKP